MLFTFHDEAGLPQLELKGESFKYLIKVRRHQIGDTIALRQRDNPEMLHHYQLQELDGRRALLKLEQSEKYGVSAKKTLHLGWCLIDPKSIEKVLPQLNESGVGKITFITCKRSQKNFKLDFERFYRILETSSQQCGRSQKMLFDQCDSLSAFLHHHPQSAIFDFGGKVLKERDTVDTVVIGCEGGFSEEERLLFDTQYLFTFDTPMILRSETAAVAISNQILL
jgi:16S rRNA (uracil1498-N3)-methyltransferase